MHRNSPEYLLSIKSMNKRLCVYSEISKSRILISEIIETQEPYLYISVSVPYPDRGNKQNLLPWF